MAESYREQEERDHETCTTLKKAPLWEGPNEQFPYKTCVRPTADRNIYKCLHFYLHPKQQKS